MYYFLNE